MGRRIVIQLTSVTPLLNTVQRTHWAKRSKQRRALAWEVRVAAKGSIPAEPFARARVTVERRSIGTPDFDGVVGGMKALLDVLQPVSKRHPTGLGFIANDSPGCIDLVPVALRVATRGEQGTTVIVEELS